jgi:hypothetical protein
MNYSIGIQLTRNLVITVMCAAAAAAQNPLATDDPMVSGSQPPGAEINNAPPEESFRVLPPAVAQGPQITPYLLYQTALAWDEDKLRLNRWSQVQNENDLLQLQSELRKSVLQMVGGLPTVKTDLHPTVTGTVSATGFHIDKLIYQSLPGFYVTALVYVPDNGTTVHPAVLVPAGHSPNGKLHYLDLCQRLALRGYLVISWDPVGQGERSQFWDAEKKKSRYDLTCGEHAVMGNLAYLAGANQHHRNQRWRLSDCVAGRVG